jgi:hypothetical protein
VFRGKHVINFCSTDNISVRSLYSHVEGSRECDDATAELLVDSDSNIYDQIEHSPPIYQNTAFPTRARLMPEVGQNMLDNDVYSAESSAHPPNVYQRLQSVVESPPLPPPLLVRRPSQRNRGNRTTIPSTFRTATPPPWSGVWIEQDMYKVPGFILVELTKTCPSSHS